MPGKTGVHVIQQSEKGVPWVETRGKKENKAVVLAMLTCFFGGYLLGCLLMNLYWKYTDRAAAAAFYISVYDKTVPEGYAKTIFWQILGRDFRVLSLAFVIGLLPGAGMLIGMLLGMTGALLGILTSGILLTEGVYWWLRGLLWMLPCFVCSGSVLFLEMLYAWQEKYHLQRSGVPMWKQCLTYGGHILLVFLVTAMASRVESQFLYNFFTKK